MVARKTFCVTLTLDVHHVSCPGVWLCSKAGSVLLRCQLFGVSCQTKGVQPSFPLYYHERFTFQKRVLNAGSGSEARDHFLNKQLRLEALQLKSPHSGDAAAGSGDVVMLASFCSRLDHVMYPGAEVPPAQNRNRRGSKRREQETIEDEVKDIELLLTPSQRYPGIIGPSVHSSVKMKIEEVGDEEDCRRPGIAAGVPHHVRPNAKIPAAAAARNKTSSNPYTERGGVGASGAAGAEGAAVTSSGCGGGGIKRQKKVCHTKVKDETSLPCGCYRVEEQKTSNQMPPEVATPLFQQSINNLQQQQHQQQQQRKKGGGCCGKRAGVGGSKFRRKSEPRTRLVAGQDEGNKKIEELEGCKCVVCTKYKGYFIDKGGADEYYEGDESSGATSQNKNYPNRNRQTATDYGDGGKRRGKQSLVKCQNCGKHVRPNRRSRSGVVAGRSDQEYEDDPGVTSDAVTSTSTSATEEEETLSTAAATSRRCPMDGGQSTRSRREDRKEAASNSNYRPSDYENGTDWRSEAGGAIGTCKCHALQDLPNPNACCSGSEELKKCEAYRFLFYENLESFYRRQLARLEQNRVADNHPCRRSVATTSTSVYQ